MLLLTCKECQTDYNNNKDKKGVYDVTLFHPGDWRYSNTTPSAFYIYLYFYLPNKCSIKRLHMITINNQSLVIKSCIPP